MYLQWFEVNSFPVCLDYQPKRVDYRGSIPILFLPLIHKSHSYISSIDRWYTGSRTETTAKSCT